MLVLAAAVAFADPVDGLDPATQPFFLKAEAEAEAGRGSAAASLYRLVLEHDPTFVPAELGLAHTLAASGDLAGAIAEYRNLPDEPEAVEALARILESTDPAGAVRLWKRLETLRLGDATAWGEEARLVAPTDAEAALAAWKMYQTLLQGQPPDPRVLLAVADASPDAAETMLRAYVEAFPDGPAAAEASQRVDRMELARAAGELDLGGDVALDDAGTQEVTAAEQALAAGRINEALGRAEALVARAPRSAAAHGLYAEALQAQSRWTEAETEAREARQLAPDDARARARLGWLLHVAYGGRHDPESADELGAAVRLRPGEAELRYRLGVVQQSLGRFDAAVATFDAYLGLAPDGRDAAEVHERLEDLRRTPPPAPPKLGSSSVALPGDALPHFRLARVLLARGRRTEARAELETALQLAPTATMLLNERARLDREDGALDAAVRGWTRSVELDPAQPDVWRNLGDAATDRADKRRAYARAAERGDVDAHYLLADLAFQDGDWNTVRTELSAYESRAPAGSYYRTAAAHLREDADRRYYGLRFGIAGVTLALLALPAVVWLRRRTARTLRDLLDRAPESWHDAARLLAALRHEILKHNTTVLPDVADALVAGDTAPWDALALRLPELDTRFGATLEAIRALGRRHGLRLDLTHRDPILAPMRRAMRRLRRLADGSRPPSPDELRALSRTLNVEGYTRIGQLVGEICVLPVTTGFLQEVYDHVSGEPSFAGGPVPALELTPAPPRNVRMFRADLQDIVANLLRNALAAGARRVGATLATGEDPITGHELVEVRIWDDAPGTLTNAMIRGRFIGRGLGLAVDLTSRHGGALFVEPGDAGLKTIVVQFPAVETAPPETG